MSLEYEDLINEEKTKHFILEIIKNILPPKEALKVSEWADKYRIISSNNAEPGKWRTDRAPYQRAMMDALCDELVEEIFIMTGVQIGKTDILNNIIAYFMDHDPSPMLMVQPTLDAARGYAKKKLKPMLDDTPKLQGIINDNKQNTLEKTFNGGFLTIVGSNSPAGLASNSIRTVLMDELDRYEEEAGTEGDQVELARKRTSTFKNSKLIGVSTPGLASKSKIAPLFESSSQARWNIPCPSCDEYVFLEIKNFDEELIKMKCTKCGCLNDELTWKRQQIKGKWIEKYPERKKKKGFHLNSFYSPWVSWAEIADEYIKAKEDPALMMVFYNTVLGLPWEGVIQEEKSWEKLYERREEYEGELPDEVLLLTAGVDTQNDRLEIEIVGWGKGEESWGIEYKSFPGDPDSPEVWKLLDEYLEKKFYYKCKEKSLQIKMTLIDTGGLRTQDVYNYVWDKSNRGIYGIKGDSHNSKGYVIRNTMVNKVNGKPVNLIFLGVNDLKDLLYTRLSIDEVGAGYCHFPLGAGRGYTPKYFKGLTAERKVEKRNSKGKIRYEWEQVRKRNEPVDLRNYATAAVKLLAPDFEELSKNGDKGRKSVNKGKIRLLKKGGKG